MDDNRYDNQNSYVAPYDVRMMNSGNEGYIGSSSTMEPIADTNGYDMPSMAYNDRIGVVNHRSPLVRPQQGRADRMMSSGPAWGNQVGTARPSGQMSLENLLSKRKERYICSDWIQGTPAEDMDALPSESSINVNVPVIGSVTDSKSQSALASVFMVFSIMVSAVGWFVFKSEAVLQTGGIFFLVALVTIIGARMDSKRRESRAGMLGIEMGYAFSLLGVNAVLLDNRKYVSGKHIRDDRYYEDGNYSTPILRAFWYPHDDNRIREWTVWWSPADTPESIVLLEDKYESAGHQVLPMYIQVKGDKCRFVVDGRYLLFRDWLNRKIAITTGIYRYMSSLKSRMDDINLTLDAYDMAPIQLEDKVTADEHIKYDGTSKYVQLIDDGDDGALHMPIENQTGGRR